MVRLSLAALALSTLAWAGDWHRGDQLVCSDCHTMHNSSGGQPMRYDQASEPAPHLLRHATAQSLCLYCHDGTNLDAPDVVGPVSYTTEPLAGFFTQPGQSSATGHDVGVPSSVTPPGGTAPMQLTCLSCHDHHGNTNYRNLRTDPLNTGGAPLTVQVTQTTAPNGSNPAQVYTRANVVWKNGLSAWCGSCHGAFHGKSSGQEGTSSPWFRHPQDLALSTSTNVDFSAWSGVVVNRVPTESPFDATVPSADDRVFCGSCHKAHGSANKAALIYADGLTLRTTCQQCHNE
jgi:predicted CXXCH cytochrome family protein